ncbi:hypothetical protein ACF0H5_017151 [Mactra antiquata]
MHYVSGKCVVLAEREYNEFSIYKIEHTHSDLTDLPSNICNWDSEPFIRDLYEDEFDNMQAFWPAVVELDFQYNRIRRLQDINCSTKLDAVNLQGNNLTYVSNNSFANLTFLRTINFTGNHIQYIDPSTIAESPLNLLNVDFSYSLMTEMDVMNLLSLHGYCEINFSHNNISRFTNKLQQSLNMSKTYGPGLTSMNNNQIESFPNLRELYVIETLNQLGKFMAFVFDIRENPINCDCTFQPILSQSVYVLGVLRNYMDIICQSPPDLADTSIRNVDPDRLFCPLPASAGCKKPECLCIDKPYDGIIYIDCSNGDLGELPDVPYSEYSSHIYLNISDNRINTIRNVSYLSKIDVIDLSKNDIVEIPSEVANLLENASVIDISDNLRLKSLPREFQRRDVCKTFMRNLEIRCDCTWIET